MPETKDTDKLVAIPAKRRKTTLSAAVDNSNSNEATMYWIKCTDNNMIPMTKKDLHGLMEKMPCLRNLLFGHPDMQQKQLDFIEGVPILEIPPFLRVNRVCLLDLVRIMKGMTRLPEEGSSEFFVLSQTIVDLGGCEYLEEKMRNAVAEKETKGPPSTPWEDLKEEYDWIVKRCAMEGERTFQEEGYLVSQDVETIHDTSMKILYFRKRKTTR